MLPRLAKLIDILENIAIVILLAILAWIQAGIIGLVPACISVAILILLFLGYSFANRMINKHKRNSPPS